MNFQIMLIISFLLFCFLARADQSLKLDGSWGESSSFSDINKRLASADPSKNKNWTPDLKGGFRTDIGAQFDVSCIKMLEAIPNLSHKEKLSKLNEALSDAASRVMRCQENYSELDPYIQEWVYRVRRQKIICEKNTNAGFLGRVEPSTDRNTFFLYKKAIDQLFSKKESQYGDTISTIIHEIFHNTSANNQNKEIHEKLESNKINPEKKCAQNPTIDRVSVLESLCSGSNINSSYSKNKFSSKAISSVFDRIQACGIEKGCENTFTDKATIIRKTEDFASLNLLPHKPLTQEKAKMLCLKIKEDGNCLKQRNSKGRELTLSHPQIIGLQKKLTERLLKIIPTENLSIPKELLNLFESSKSKFESLENETCFLEIKNSDHEKISNPIESFIYSGFKKMKEDFSQKISECANEESRIKTQQVYDDFFNELNQNNNEILQNRIAPIIAQETSIYFPRLTENELSNATLSYLDQLLGAELAENYYKTIDRLHWESPHFDCEGAGLSPCRTILHTEQAIGETKKEPNVCYESKF